MQYAIQLHHSCRVNESFFHNVCLKLHFILVLFKISKNVSYIYIHLYFIVVESSKLAIKLCVYCVSTVESCYCNIQIAPIRPLKYFFNKKFKKTIFKVKQVRGRRDVNA